MCCSFHIGIGIGIGIVKLQTGPFVQPSAAGAQAGLLGALTRDSTKRVRTATGGRSLQDAARAKEPRWEGAGFEPAPTSLAPLGGCRLRARTDLPGPAGRVQASSPHRPPWLNPAPPLPSVNSVC